MSEAGVPRDRSPHLSAEDLAVLAEGRARDPEGLAHLATCRSCMSAYSDAVRYRAAWLTAPEMFTATNPIRLRPIAARPGNTGTPARGAWMVGAAASVFVGLGLALLLAGERSPSSPYLSPAVRTMLENASGAGLVLPGGEPGAMKSPGLYRSGRFEGDDGIEAVDDLRIRYERGPRSIEHLFALAAGLVAADRIDLAHDYVSEGHRLAPTDPRFMVLAGILAHRAGDISGAESLLREARRERPGDPTIALNLGLVILEARGIEDATILLEEVTSRAPRSPLGERARSALNARR